jgi:hypothetical protein
VNKAVEHLPALRDKLSAIDDSYLNIQQDILETFVAPAESHTTGSSGEAIPGSSHDPDVRKNRANRIRTLGPIARDRCRRW